MRRLVPLRGADPTELGDGTLTIAHKNLELVCLADRHAALQHRGVNATEEGA